MRTMFPTRSCLVIIVTKISQQLLVALGSGAGRWGEGRGGGWDWTSFLLVTIITNLVFSLLSAPATASMINWRQNETNSTELSRNKDILVERSTLIYSLVGKWFPFVDMKNGNRILSSEWIILSVTGPHSGLTFIWSTRPDTNLCCHQQILQSKWTGIFINTSIFCWR